MSKDKHKADIAVHIENGEDQLIKTSWLKDLAQLVKFRLNSLVVMSAVMAAGIAHIGGATFTWIQFIELAVGGFMVSGASAILNEVLEKKYDAVMKRTALRPLPADRMSQNTAVLLAGIFSLIGIAILAMLNPLTAFLGTLALVSYAFVYTPLKRVTPFAVHIGAFPGALPVVIGVVAVEGVITPLAIILFTIQFFWQFGHFWAIAWIAHKDYTKAGFKLLPTRGNKKTKEVGVHTILYTSVLIPAAIMLYLVPGMGYITIGLVVLASVLYLYKAIQFYKDPSNETAKKLMIGSFIYLPIVLSILMIGQWI